jgi:ferredoxin-type protein NapH
VTAVSKLTLLRRSVQVFFLAAVLVIPILNRIPIRDYFEIEYGSFNLEIQEIAKESSRFDRFYGWIKTTPLSHLATRIGENVQGSPWAFHAFGFHVVDPLTAVSTFVLSGSIVPGLLLSALPLALLSILLGRVFCGYICPMHLLLEANAWVRRRLEAIGFRFHDVEFSRNNRYFLLGIGLVLSLAFGVHLLPLIYPPAVIPREVFHYTFYGTVGFGAFFILFVLATEIAVSRRWWCVYFCPGGLLYSLLGSVRGVRVVLDSGNCNLCAKCDEVCPYQLKPSSGFRIGNQCDNCGLCVSVCETNGLKYKFGFHKPG